MAAKTVIATLLHGHQAIQITLNTARRDAALYCAVTTATQVNLIVGVARRGADEINRTTQGAGPIRERIGATGDYRITGRQRVNKTVVVVAISSGHRQPVDHQLDAVAIVGDRIQIGAATGKKGVVTGRARGRPDTRHITQHVTDADHVTLGQVFRFHQRHPARRQGLLPLKLGFCGCCAMRLLLGNRNRCQFIGLGFHRKHTDW